MHKDQPGARRGLTGLLVAVLLCGVCRPLKMYEGSKLPEGEISQLSFTGPVVVREVDGKRLGLFGFSSNLGRYATLDLHPGDHSIEVWFNTAGSTRRTSTNAIQLAADAGRKYEIHYKIIGPSISSAYGNVPDEQPWRAWVEDVTDESPETTRPHPDASCSDC